MLLEGFFYLSHFVSASVFSGVLGAVLGLTGGMILYGLLGEFAEKFKLVLSVFLLAAVAFLFLTPGVADFFHGIGFLEGGGISAPSLIGLMISMGINLLAAVIYAFRRHTGKTAPVRKASAPQEEKLSVPEPTVHDEEKASVPADVQQLVIPPPAPSIDLAEVQRQGEAVCQLYQRPDEMAQIKIFVETNGLQSDLANRLVVLFPRELLRDPNADQCNQRIQLIIDWVSSLHVGPQPPEALLQFKRNLLLAVFEEIVRRSKERGAEGMTIRALRVTLAHTLAHHLEFPALRLLEIVAHEHHRRDFPLPDDDHSNQAATLERLVFNPHYGVPLRTTHCLIFDDAKQAESIMPHLLQHACGAVQPQAQLLANAGIANYANQDVVTYLICLAKERGLLNEFQEALFENLPQSNLSGFAVQKRLDCLTSKNAYLLPLLRMLMPQRAPYGFFVSAATAERFQTQLLDPSKGTQLRELCLDFQTVEIAHDKMDWLSSVGVPSPRGRQAALIYAMLHNKHPEVLGYLASLVSGNEECFLSTLKTLEVSYTNLMTIARALSQHMAPSPHTSNLVSHILGMAIGDVNTLQDRWKARTCLLFSDLAEAKRLMPCLSTRFCSAQILADTMVVNHENPPVLQYLSAWIKEMRSPQTHFTDLIVESVWAAASPKETLFSAKTFLACTKNLAPYLLTDADEKLPSPLEVSIIKHVFQEYGRLCKMIPGQVATWDADNCHGVLRSMWQVIPQAVPRDQSLWDPLAKNPAFMKLVVDMMWPLPEADFMVCAKSLASYFPVGALNEIIFTRALQAYQAYAVIPKGPRTWTKERCHTVLCATFQHATVCQLLGEEEQHYSRPNAEAFLQALQSDRALRKRCLSFVNPEHAKAGMQWLTICLRADVVHRHGIDDTVRREAALCVMIYNYHNPNIIVEFATLLSTKDSLYTHTALLQNLDIDSPRIVQAIVAALPNDAQQRVFCSQIARSYCYSELPQFMRRLDILVMLTWFFERLPVAGGYSNFFHGYGVSKEVNLQRNFETALASPHNWTNTHTTTLLLLQFLQSARCFVAPPYGLLRDVLSKYSKALQACITGQHGANGHEMIWVLLMYDQAVTGLNSIGCASGFLSIGDQEFFPWLISVMTAHAEQPLTASYAPNTPGRVIYELIQAGAGKRWLETCPQINVTLPAKRLVALLRTDLPQMPDALINIIADMLREEPFVTETRPLVKSLNALPKQSLASLLGAHLSQMPPVLLEIIADYLLIPLVSNKAAADSKDDHQAFTLERIEAYLDSPTVFYDEREEKREDAEDAKEASRHLVAASQSGRLTLMPAPTSAPQLPAFPSRDSWCKVS